MMAGEYNFRTLEDMMRDPRRWNKFWYYLSIAWFKYIRRMPDSWMDIWKFMSNPKQPWNT